MSGLGLGTASKEEVSLRGRSHASGRLCPRRLFGHGRAHVRGPDVAPSRPGAPEGQRSSLARSPARR